jgi:nucleoside-diphosphate-sugar epimerase
MRVAVIGSSGFVGSAFVRHVRREGHELLEVTRDSYPEMAGTECDVVVDASANASKVLAEQRPYEDFHRSVSHRIRTLADFPSAFHVHVSSVDVYDDLASPATTTETTLPNPARQSRYGFHKYLAEQCVMHSAPRWLIVRLAGMVGPGLRKNPVFDIANGLPLRIHPDSAYQFMSTDDAARITWWLVKRDITNDVYNVCGRGLISPRRIAELADRPIDLSLLPPEATPRVVHVSHARLESLIDVPSTESAVRGFLHARPSTSGGTTESTVLELPIPIDEWRRATGQG